MHDHMFIITKQDAHSFKEEKSLLRSKKRTRKNKEKRKKKKNNIERNKQVHLKTRPSGFMIHTKQLHMIVSIII